MPVEARRGCWTLGAGGRDGSELCDRSLKTKLRPSGRAAALLAAEPAPGFIFLCLFVSETGSYSVTQADFELASVS